MAEQKPDVRPGDVIELRIGAVNQMVRLLVRVTDVFVGEGRRLWAYTGYFMDDLRPQAPTCGYFCDQRWRLRRRGGVAVDG